MSNEYEIQPLSWIVKPKGADLFADAVTRITRDDEAAGQFLLISQDRSEAGQIAISIEEWPAIKQAIETAFDAILADELHTFAPGEKS